VLQVEEVADPQPGEGEVLVRIEAAGINHADLSRRAGGAETFPTILGYDAAGRRADTGERVLVTSTPGTYAELVAANGKNVFAIPDSLDTAAAAAIGVPYKTAWWALVDMGGLKKGDTLLVQGAATGTGQAAIDIGRSLGVNVYATSRADKLDKVRALGAEGLEYGDPKVRELDANVVFDPIGADTFSDSVEAIAQEGTLVTPGAVGNIRRPRALRPRPQPARAASGRSAHKGSRADGQVPALLSARRWPRANIDGTTLVHAEAYETEAQKGGADGQ
jgi:NADPH2:quinone reductase